MRIADKLTRVLALTVAMVMLLCCISDTALPASANGDETAVEQTVPQSDSEVQGTDDISQVTPQETVLEQAETEMGGADEMASPESEIAPDLSETDETVDESAPVEAESDGEILQTGTEDAPDSDIPEEVQTSESETVSGNETTGTEVEDNTAVEIASETETSEMEGAGAEGSENEKAEGLSDKSELSTVTDALQPTGDSSEDETQVDLPESETVESENEAVPFLQTSTIDGYKVSISAAAGVFAVDAILGIDTVCSNSFLQAVEEELNTQPDGNTTFTHHVFSFYGAAMNGEAEVTIEKLGLTDLAEHHPEAEISVRIYKYNAQNPEKTAENVPARVSMLRDTVVFAITEISSFDIVVLITNNSTEIEEVQQTVSEGDAEVDPAFGADGETVEPVEQETLSVETGLEENGASEPNELNAEESEATSDNICEPQGTQEGSISEETDTPDAPIGTDGNAEDDGAVDTDMVANSSETEDNEPSDEAVNDPAETVTEPSTQDSQVGMDETGEPTEDDAGEMETEDGNADVQPVNASSEETLDQAEQEESEIGNETETPNADVVDDNNGTDANQDPVSEEEEQQNELQMDETTEPTVEVQEDGNTEKSDILLASTGEAAANAAIIGVWYDKGIEGKQLPIHATTNLEAQFLYLYLGDTLLQTWSAAESDITVNSANKEWHVGYTFADSGFYYLRYAASNDGTVVGESYQPEPVEIERPAIIDIWYEQGIENTPLKIHVTTNLSMQYLYLYLGESQIGSWQAAEAEIVEYATCKEWVVSYTFGEPGPYYVWYKASKDGSEMSAPFSQPDPVMIERPAVIDVWYEPGVENKPLQIHVTTSLDMQYLYMYLGDEEVGSWSKDEATIVEYATCTEWVISETFAEPGQYHLWYKASRDNVTMSNPYAGAPAEIERPAIIEVWYEPLVENKPSCIHVTTSLEMNYLYLYLGEEEIDSWTAAETDIIEYATCKEWVVTHTFEEPGMYYLWYKASKDGVNMGTPFAPDPVENERPAVIEVEYGQAAVGETLEIKVTTNNSMNYLYMYQGEELIASWQRGEVGLVIEDYDSCDVWVVGYAFDYEGEQHLWYKASEDGINMSNAFAFDPAIVDAQPDDLAEFVIAAVGDTTAKLSKYNGTAEDVVVPSVIDGYTIVAIGENAFKGKALQTVTIPNTVTSIEKSAFEECASLTTVTLSDNVEIIGEAAFMNCVSLSSMVIAN